MPESSKARDLSWACTAALQGGRDSRESAAASAAASASRAAISNQHHGRVLSSRRPCSDIFRPPTPNPTAQAPWPCGRTPANMPALLVAGAQVPLRQAHLHLHHLDQVSLSLAHHHTAQRLRRLSAILHGIAMDPRWTSMHGGSPEARMRCDGMTWLCLSSIVCSISAPLCSNSALCTVPPSNAHSSAGGGGYF